MARLKEIIYSIVVLSLSSLLFNSCDSISYKITSPDKTIELTTGVSNYHPFYSVKFNKKVVVKPSKLGFTLNNSYKDFSQFVVRDYEITEHNSSWKMVLGEQDSVVDNYNKIILYLEEKYKPFRKLQIVFRVYNDGVGFRYIFPEQNTLKEIKIAEEHSEFNLQKNDTCWWIPADYDCYEHLYSKTTLHEINAQSYLNNGLAASSINNLFAVNTPVTIKKNSNIFLSIHEANLTNYSGMTLALNKSKDGFISELVPSITSNKVVVKAPFVTPWRMIQVADKAKNLIDSRLILNLNEPCKIKNTDWIKPMKYIGIWWGMHISKNSWSYGYKHGATTKNAIKYIDFASEHNINGVLIEGWNTGWENWIGDNREDVFDFVTPYPDYDINLIAEYAASKNVEIIGHHETSAVISTYERQLDTAFQFYKHFNINNIKTGYVGKIIPNGHYHHSQWMVNHYREVLEKASEMEITIDAHEPIKPTGIRRTYPNMLSREGVRGQEFNAWSTGNPPNHLTIIPFTRMLAGPIDYTPGIFNLTFNEYKKGYRVNATIANQLALYVVLYSPVQMAADIIEHYKNQPAFEFIEKVPVNWNYSKVIDAEIGEYIVTARKADNNWYLGAITNERYRNINISMDFLDTKRNYMIKVFTDDIETNWETNPEIIEIDSFLVKSSETVSITMSNCGGFAAIIIPVSDSISKLLKPIHEFNIEKNNKIEAYKSIYVYGTPKKVSNLAYLKSIKFITNYDPKYAAQGDKTLINEILGNPLFPEENWLGYKSNNIQFIVDLKDSVTIKKLTTHFLQKHESNIVLPYRILYSVSDDGENYKLVAAFYNSYENWISGTQSVSFEREYWGIKTRYIKVEAMSPKVMPDKITDNKGDAWLFIDELIIN